MSLKGIKEKLNIDQQNIMTCVVVNDFDTYTLIRTPKGGQFRAGKTAGVSFDAGDSVEVRTDKKVYTILGDSSYARYSAERSYSL